MQETNFFSNQTIQVYDYFEKWLFAKSDYPSGEFKKSIYCELFDSFNQKEIEVSNDLEKNYHNCIGCNFEEGCLTILDFLKRFSGTTNIRAYLTIYSLLFYSQAERLGVIYRELGFTADDKFDWERFPILRTIKHWANLFKHPKAYMFLHHPDYYIETDPGKPDFMIKGVVDTDFIENFYRARADNDMLQKLFENGTQFKIFYPDLLQFTKDLCEQFSAIIPVIQEESNLKVLRRYTIDSLE